VHTVLLFIAVPLPPPLPLPHDTLHVSPHCPSLHPQNIPSLPPVCFHSASLSGRQKNILARIDLGPFHRRTKRKVVGSRLHAKGTMGGEMPGPVGSRQKHRRRSLLYITGLRAAYLTGFLSRRDPPFNLGDVQGRLWVNTWVGLHSSTMAFAALLIHRGAFVVRDTSLDLTHDAPHHDGCFSLPSSSCTSSLAQRCARQLTPSVDAVPHGIPDPVLVTP
jgi:hypothetical protein